MSQSSFERICQALDARGLIAHDRRASGQVFAHCLCGVHENGDRDASLSVTHTGDRTLIHCFAGGDTEEIVGLLGLGMRDLFDNPGRACDLRTPAERLQDRLRSTPINMFTSLAELLGLDEVKRSITEVRTYGRGGNATVYIVLDDDSEIVLDELRHYLSPNKLAFEIAAQTGATPTLKGPQVLDVARLIHDLGDHHAMFEVEDRARDLGAEYLRTAAIGEVDMSDQASRWKAFSALTGPGKDVVLVDPKTGIRYVRAHWLTEYLRAHLGPGEVATMLTAFERLGWSKPGREGRIKATQPQFGRELVWAFYTVPKDWA